MLVDIVKGLAEGKALDMYEASPIVGVDAEITGATTYRATRNSDVVVITSGIARRPGMSRDDLLATNMKIVGEVTEKAVRQSPDAILVVVSNPLDAMCHVALKASGLPAKRVVGMAGVLDSARFRYFVAEEMEVSIEDVTAFVLGGHGGHRGAGADAAHAHPVGVDGVQRAQVLEGPHQVLDVLDDDTLL